MNLRNRQKKLLVWTAKGKEIGEILTQAQDLMVINVTKETIKVRMAVADEYDLPPYVTESYE